MNPIYETGRRIASMESHPRIHGMGDGMQASDRNKRRPRSRYAVLGMLSMGLETGYAMKKHVEANLGHFWNESYGANSS
jgi:hypothetical protein